MDGGDLWLEISLVIGFILISGLFAAAEIALVSLRDSQIQQLSTRGRRGHVLAGLAKNPTRTNHYANRTFLIYSVCPDGT